MTPHVIGSPRWRSCAVIRSHIMNLQKDSQENLFLPSHLALDLQKKAQFCNL